MPDRFELKDLNASVVTLFIVGVPLLVGAALWIAASFPGEASAGDAGLPAPGSSAAWGRELEELRRTEAGLLDSYGWVDRERGIVRVPSDRAIDLFLAEQENR